MENFVTLERKKKGNKKTKKQKHMKYYEREKTSETNKIFTNPSLPHTHFSACVHIFI